MDFDLLNKKILGRVGVGWGWGMPLDPPSFQSFSFQAITMAAVTKILTWMLPLSEIF